VRQLTADNNKRALIFLPLNHFHSHDDPKLRFNIAKEDQHLNRAQLNDKYVKVR
jgi:hypothetical protein